MIRNSPEVAQRKAIGALQLIGTDAVPALLSLIEDPSPNVRWYVIDALGRIGRSAAAAVPAIRRALKDDDDQVRSVAAWAIDAIGIYEETETPPMSE